MWTFQLDWILLGLTWRQFMVELLHPTSDGCLRPCVWLMRIIYNNMMDSVIGRSYGFKHIFSIKQYQNRSFSEQCWEFEHSSSFSSQILRLSPFIESENIFRCSRLITSSISGGENIWLLFLCCWLEIWKSSKEFFSSVHSCGHTAHCWLASRRTQDGRRDHSRRSFLIDRT